MIPEGTKIELDGPSFLREKRIQWIDSDRNTSSPTALKRWVKLSGLPHVVQLLRWCSNSPTPEINSPGIAKTQFPRVTPGITKISHY